MNTLIYIPTGLPSPELEILLAKAQEAIDAGEKTTVVTCAGGAGYACSLNIYGLRPLCRVCKAQTKRGLALLKGDFTHVETPTRIDVPPCEGARKMLLKDRWAIKKYEIEGVDVGQAAYSSYIGMSRDQDLEGRLAGWSQNKLLATSEKLFAWFRSYVREKNTTRIVLYNGRQNQYRPLLRVAQLEKIDIDIMEFAGQEANCVYTFRNELPQDIETLSQRIETYWQTHKDDAVKHQKGKDYFVIKRSGGAINDVSYVPNQQQGMLPDGWNPNKHNIGVFNSSEDELTALGGTYDKTLYKNQLEAMTRLCTTLQDDGDIVLWLRIHPNLAGVHWNFAQRLLSLESLYSNIRVIPAKSPVSSYALLEACDTVVSFGSTIGVEAAYWGKPSILLGRCVYEKLDSVYIPNTHEETVALMRQRNLPPLSIEGALKMAMFWSVGGSPINHLGGNRKQGFNFFDQKIRMRSYERWMYLFYKFIEKCILGYAVNYGLGTTRVHLKN